MKIFYWSPFLSNIATIDAVIRSIKSINKFDNKKFYKAYFARRNRRMAIK